MLNPKRAFTCSLARLVPAVLVPAVIVMTAAACASETGAEVEAGTSRVASAAEAIELAVPEHGFQVETAGTWIEPDDDVRMCEVVVLPGDSTQLYYVNRIQSAISAHSEDLIVRAAAPGSETASVMDRGASLPCTRAGEAFGEELTDVLRSQSRNADERFPTGAGKIFQGGQKLAVEYHVVNDTEDAAQAKAKLSFHVVDANQIQHLVRTASFENFTIYTPPNGHSSHVGECRVRQEMVVSDLVRRTQRYGTSFKVWRVTANQDQDAGQQDAASEPRGDELIWDSAERKDSRTSFSTPLHLLPGDGFRFQCDYENPTDHELRYGVSAADETCTLEAIFWPARPDTETQAAVSEDCLLSNVDSDGVARPRL